MIRFVGAVNDGADWFILADIANLNRLQLQHQLGSDLLEVFTTADIGDHVVEQGVMLPLMGISNLPYTILFNLDETSAFTRAGVRPTHQQAGYVIEVISGQLHLFTVPFLEDWPPNAAKLVDLAKRQLRPVVELANGWYSVTVNVGDIETEECTSVIEFCLQPVAQPPAFNADVNYQFTIE